MSLAYYISELFHFTWSGCYLLWLYLHLKQRERQKNIPRHRATKVYLHFKLDLSLNGTYVNLCICKFVSMCVCTVCAKIVDEIMMSWLQNTQFCSTRMQCSSLQHNRVLKWWRHEWFSEIMGFIRLFRSTYLQKVHMQKKWLFSALNSWDMGVWSSNCFILNSYLLLVPEVRNRC